jgi:membrane protease subunit HflC
MTQTTISAKVAAWRWAGFTTGILLVFALSTSFIARENEKAVVLRFGKPVRTIDDAGWHARLPWPVDRIVRMDARLQHAEIRLSETLTKDKRNVVVPMFYAWRVADAVKFLASVGTEEGAEEKLDAILTSARNAVLGRRSFEELVAAGSQQSVLAQLEEEILRDAADDSAKHLGIELADAGILQIKLPQANTEAVFRRMRAERKREASQYRAEGRSKAETIRAETDKEVAMILADAKRYAEETRGKAEADAARIYAEAHGRDVQFYEFLRQLQSLRSVVDRNTTLVLDTSVEPFSLLKTGHRGLLRDAEQRSEPVQSPQPSGSGNGSKPVVIGPLISEPTPTAR